MEQQDFEALITNLCQLDNLPEALNALKATEDEEIAQAAESLAGQFSLADVDGEKRIYHVFTETNDDGEEQEFVEHVMNEGDDVLVFISWFFYAMFEVKHKDTYAAAGRTYQQPKRS